MKKYKVSWETGYGVAWVIVDAQNIERAITDTEIRCEQITRDNIISIGEVGREDKHVRH
jgi:hypothetical protein